MEQKLVIYEEDFEKPKVGDVVAVTAVDWGQVQEEVSKLSIFELVRGTIYGKVIAVDEEKLTLAFQVFISGNVRGVLTIPWVTVESVTILSGEEDD